MCSLPFPKEIKTLLVDDENIALHRLKKALQNYPAIKIVGEAKNGKTAIDFIHQQRPDLVFLDIQMPAYNGFEVLQQLHYTPLIVFVTAYEAYAVKAFEQNSLDYLLKPVEVERLDITIKRVTERLADGTNMLQKIKILLDEQPGIRSISTLPVKTGNKIQLVQVSDICYFEAKDKYVYLHTQTGAWLTDYSLSYLQELLPPEFVRVHRSFIVNKLKIIEIHKYFKGTYLLLINDTQRTKIKSSYSYYATIQAALLLP
ncbi:LytR/AlgR family response regulator transcription factor [Chitinophaga sp. 30R24]|uniref:LytR/AlgR family response regulator transcription factor n=1 Tax=Chitinophaga sp. 30R24 TaxID=3248838 RepID=UPI003B911B21